MVSLEWDVFAHQQLSSVMQGGAVGVCVCVCVCVCVDVYSHVQYYAMIGGPSTLRDCGTPTSRDDDVIVEYSANAGESVLRCVSSTSTRRSAVAKKAPCIQVRVWILSGCESVSTP